MAGKQQKKQQRGVNLNKKKKKTRRGKKHHRPVNVERIRHRMNITSLEQITLPMFQNMCNLHNQTRDILEERRGEMVKMKEDMIRFEQKLGSLTMAFNDATNKLRASREYFKKLHAYCREVTAPEHHKQLDDYWTEFKESGLLDGYNIPGLKPFELTTIKGKKPRPGPKIINLPPMSPAPEQPSFMETDSLWNPSEVMRPQGLEPLALLPQVQETTAKEAPKLPMQSTSTAQRVPMQSTSTSIIKERFRELAAQEVANKPEPPPEMYKDWTLLISDTHKQQVRLQKPFEWQHQRHIIARNYTKVEMMFWKASDIDRAVRKNKEMTPLTEKEEELTDKFEEAITDVHMGPVAETDWFLEPDLGNPKDPKVLEHRILVTLLHFLSKDVITDDGRRLIKEDADKEQQEKDDLILESADENSTG